jgi:glycerol-3-phosphate dehydrogenase
VERPVDLLVVGGGINGAGIARDAAGRGLSVVLCEKGDLAGGTSSASSKLIHGGLRYLEHLEFRLVREALYEREVLLHAAPHIIRPLRFILPHATGLRPAWMLRVGLVLYDRLGGRERLPPSSAVDLRRDPVGAPLKASFTRGFSYADCWVDDARLVVLTAVDARDRGAEVRTRTRCIGARRTDGMWEAELESAGGGRTRLRARALVNAAGPWVDEMLGQISGATRKSGLRLVKGSHIVVPRLHDGDQAYILQNRDRRVFFVLPYEDRFSLIGTTEEPYEGDLGAVHISDSETAYLCEAANRYFTRGVSPGDVVWSYAGVRPLYDDARVSASAITRDYVFDLDWGNGQPPLLSVFGGKITTFRKLAEHALGKLAPHLPHAGPAWTQTAALPGGDMPGHWPAGSHGPTGRGPRTCWDRRRAWTTSAVTWATISTRPKLNICAARNGPGAWRISCGGARSWACMSPRRLGASWRIGSLPAARRSAPGPTAVSRSASDASNRVDRRA